jgi:hypothetical protein
MMEACIEREREREREIMGKVRKNIEGFGLAKEGRLLGGD